MAHPRRVVIANLLVIVLQPQHGEGLFGLAKLPNRRGGGKVWENPQGDDGKADGGRALDQEQPPPAADPVGTIQPAGDAASQQPPKGARQDGGADVDGKPLALLLLLVPRRQQQQDPRGEACFEHAHQHAKGDEGLVGGRKRHAASDGAPHDHDAREVEGRAGAAEDHVGGDLEDDVGDKEDHQGNAVAGRV